MSKLDPNDLALMREELRKALRGIHWRLDGIGRELRALREATEGKRLLDLETRLRPLAKARPRDSD